jgi:hypothetical protein
VTNAPTQESLRTLIHISALKQGAIDLEGFANATLGTNREIGSSSHGKTVDYIRDRLQQHESYYDVELQPVPVEIGRAELVLKDGEEIYAIYANWVQGSSLGTAEGLLRRVGGKGCDDVSGR